MTSTRKRLLAYCAALPLALLAPLAVPSPANATSRSVASPTDVRATPHVGSITISWRAPSDVDSSRTSTYTVVSLPHGRSCTTTRTSCTVGGITTQTHWRFSVTAHTTAGASRPSTWTSALHTVVVLVVAGQSNATGAESYVLDPTTHRSIFSGASKADSRVRMSFWGPYFHRSGIPPRSLDYPQVNSSDHHVVTFGPEIGLVRGLWAAGHHSLLVSKVVANGTSLAVNWRLHGKLFDELVGRTRALLNWAASKGWSSSIGGIYWVQGESDALRAPYAAAYDRRLTAFIAAVRAALPCNRATPFVLAETTIAPWVRYDARHGGCGKTSCQKLLTYDSIVRAAQMSVAKHVRDVFITDTMHLPRMSIQLHLSRIGELDLGQSFARLSSQHLT
jgi:hypothetical protein